MHWLLEPPARRGWAVIAIAVASSSMVSSCYSIGDGTQPPPESFYFPVGLAVSRGGNVLYVVNSDFDLQWNGGTIQSYDLDQIRVDAATVVVDELAGIPLPPSISGNLAHQPGPALGQCPNKPVINWLDGTGRAPLGETCAPPINSYAYVRDSVIIGAFATDIQLSPYGSRFFIPVRGDASLTWGDIALDDPTVAPGPGATRATYAPFVIDCGVRAEGRCDLAHHAGVNAHEPGNTRDIVMPGEPFALAQSQDGTSLVVTHQSSQQASLFLTGLGAGGTPTTPATAPSLQFVIAASGGLMLPNGGDGIVAIPHDNFAFGCAPGAPCPAAPDPAFLETNNSAAQLNLIREYPDDGSTLHRPHIINESSIPLSVNMPGTDSRGIAIDATPRLACELKGGLTATTGGGVSPADPRICQCAQQPANLYIANRTPPSLILGQVGVLPFYGPPVCEPGNYTPDSVSLFGNVPLLGGVSKVYVAPIVNSAGNYELRVFVVAFDSNSVFIYNPSTKQVDRVPVGNGPFAMAFDPFTQEDLALGKPVLGDPRHPDPQAATNPLGLKAYRFAYVASFTNSYVQVIDLDDSRTDKSTFETVVYTVGSPTIPKGTQQQ
jgi:hypothetical protein